MMKSPIWMSCISGLMVLAGCSQSQPVAAAEQVVEPAIAPVLAQAPRTFGGCIADLKQQATDSGIGAETIGRGFMGVRRLDEVIRLDRAQPEFTAGFADYYTRRVSADRIQRGQQLLQRHADLFARIEAEYGVPAHYLLAFWGLETNFGGYFGNTPILSALTTLACDGRRSDFFAGEMINALKLIQAGDLQPEQMRGSWAGAMGHVQFMPTTFLQYAVDGDADGRRDLWGSVPDAMSSAANFLRGLGWQRGVRWGREVTLPDGFDYRQSGLQTRLSLQDWAALGVQTVDGSPIAGADLQAALLVPTGSQGPAFLVYDNFNVIMGWNRAEAYALAVGLLADRIAGAAPPSRSPVESPRLYRHQVISMQQYLNANGFDAGEADGVFGPATRAAIGRFQHANGLVADGFPTQGLLHLLGAE